MKFDVKEIIDKHGIDAAVAVHKALSNPKPLTKEQVYETLDAMFPAKDADILKEFFGQDIIERKEAMKYFWNEIRPDLLNGNSSISHVATTGKYYLAKYNDISKSFNKETNEGTLLKLDNTQRLGGN